MSFGPELDAILDELKTLRMKVKMYETQMKDVKDVIYQDIKKIANEQVRLSRKENEEKYQQKEKELRASLDLDRKLMDNNKILYEKNMQLELKKVKDQLEQTKSISQQDIKEKLIKSINIINKLQEERDDVKKEYDNLFPELNKCKHEQAKLETVNKVLLETIKKKDEILKQFEEKEKEKNKLLKENEIKIKDLLQDITEYVRFINFCKENHPQLEEKNKLLQTQIDKLTNNLEINENYFYIRLNQFKENEMYLVEKLNESRSNEVERNESIKNLKKILKKVIKISDRRQSKNEEYLRELDILKPTNLKLTTNNEKLEKHNNLLMQENLDLINKLTEFNSAIEIRENLLLKNKRIETNILELSKENDELKNIIQNLNNEKNNEKKTLNDELFKMLLSQVPNVINELIQTLKVQSEESLKDIRKSTDQLKDSIKENVKEFFLKFENKNTVNGKLKNKIKSIIIQNDIKEKEIKNKVNSVLIEPQNLSQENPKQYYENYFDGEDIKLEIKDYFNPNTLKAWDSRMTSLEWAVQKHCNTQRKRNNK